MNIKQAILTKNKCYIAGKTIAVKGLMIHSVGCNQPSAEVFVKNWNTATPGGNQVCVHAFLEADGDVYQTLPWNWRGWHCGSGANGSGNNTHIGVEMTEPATIKCTGGASWVENGNDGGANTKKHVLGTYKTAVELFSFLCGEYGLDPLADGVIISHSEGHKRGVASNHGDVEHIWSKFGLTMAQFRQDIKAAMGGAAPAPAPPTPTATKTPIMGKAECTAGQLNAYAKKNNPNAPEYGAFFIEEGNAEGVRGDIAFCQSCLETGFFKFGGDVSASQNNFCGLGATGGGVKGASFATPRDGIRAQIQHLKAYASKDALKNPCIDPRFNLVTRGAAPNWEDLGGRWAVPGNGYGENIVKLWNAAKAMSVTPSAPVSETPPAAEFTPYLVKITADVLNYRSGAGTNYPAGGTVKKGEVYTIVGEANGAGASKWGKLKSGAGWISLDYTVKNK